MGRLCNFCLLLDADMALYAAKETGRDQVKRSDTRRIRDVWWRSTTPGGSPIRAQLVFLPKLLVNCWQLYDNPAPLDGF